MANRQHPIFVKYTRQWLHEATGFSKGYLSRVATGKSPLSPFFIERACFRLNKSKEELFSLDCVQPGQRLEPGGCSDSSIGQWLSDRCREEGLSLRQAAAKTGLRHGTIFDIINGTHPSPQAIKKLVQAFGGNGQQRLALEDRLLALAGYRTEWPEEELNEVLARLIDRAKQLSQQQLEIVLRFIDFLLKIDEDKAS